MEITTYRETYNQPVDKIDVPDELRNGGFEVYFMPLSTTRQSSETRQKIGGAGDMMRAYFADVPYADSLDDDFSLPRREIYPPLAVD